MNQTKAFVEALQKWDEVTSSKNRVNDFNDLIFLLLYTLGERREEIYSPKTEVVEERINFLEERIHSLMVEQKISEDFLVMGCVNFITERLEDTINFHGERIIYCIEQMEQTEDETSKEKLQKELNKLKDITYSVHAEFELYQWKVLVAEYFDRYQRNIWEGERKQST